MNTSNIKYAVGIDFGHGETSFGVYKISWGKDISQQDYDDPTISTLDKSVSIPSIYLIDKISGVTFIGDEAMRMSELVPIQNAVLGVSFKKKISLMSKEEKNFFKNYISGVKLLIESLKPELIDNRNQGGECNYAVYIAHPSGWENTEDEPYVNLAIEAGLPVCGIWPESRAAMIRYLSNVNASDIANGTAITLHDINISNKGCVLMDIGSSTTDFSYINENMNFPIDDNGNDCGGQIIDELLLQFILNLPCNEDARNAIKNDYNESYYNYVLYQIRKEKERTFSGTQGLLFKFNDFYGDHNILCKLNACPMETIVKLLEKGLDGVGVLPIETPKYSNYPAFVKNSIKQGFIPALHQELSKFISTYISSQNTEIACFILTGGTTNIFRKFKAIGIDYFKESILTKNLKEYSELPVFFDGKPSTSVSNGLALLARNYNLYEGCLDYEQCDGDNINHAKGLKNELDEMIDSQLNSISASSLVSNIAEKIKNEILNKASSTVSSFAGYHEKNPSLNDLKSNLKIAITTACNSNPEIIKKAIDECLQTNLATASDHIQKLVKSYTIQAVHIPPISNYKPSKNVGITVDYDDLINSISTLLGEQFVVAILYFLLLPGLSVIWAGAKGISKLSGKNDVPDYDEFFKNFIEEGDGIMDDIASRGRLRAERERIESKYKDKKYELSNEIIGKLKKELTPEITKVNDGIKSAISQYKKDAFMAIERVFK